MSNGKEPLERAKEVLVYGPIGLAMYLRDTAPSFMKVFVARGRAELDQQRRTVGDQLGQARTVGETTTDSTAPQLLRMVAEGLDRVRETAEGALGTLSGWAGESVSWSPGAAPDDGPPNASTPDASTPDASTPDASTPDYGMRDDGMRDDEPATAAPSSTAHDASALAIADYDELSASQVVDRLEGLAPEALAAIRVYEGATRARSTILGKIDQLERPA